MNHHLIPVNNITLHVAEEGSGPAVIFCHGFPAIWSSWRSQIEAVSASGWRAFAPDMRGYGGSDAREEADRYTPFYTAGDLVGLLDHFGLETAVLIGHDFGASICWNAAMMRPDRFNAVFGLNVPFIQPGGPSFLDQLRATGRTDFYMFRQMRPESDIEWANADVSIPGMIYWTSGHAPDHLRWDPFDPKRGLLRPAPAPLPWVDSSYLEEAIQSFNNKGFHGPLNYYRAIDPFFAVASGLYAGAGITQPSGFLTGALDGLNSVRQPTEEGLRTALLDLREFIVLDGVGHWPQFEAPDLLNAAILRFLEGLR